MKTGSINRRAEPFLAFLFFSLGLCVDEAYVKVRPAMVGAMVRGRNDHGSDDEDMFRLFHLM